MPACEKCWADAYQPGREDTQDERYRALLWGRVANPCTPRQRAGQWWDDERQADRRALELEAQETIT